MHEKCATCQVRCDIDKSEEPACCKWFLDNVVIGGDSVKNCTEYVPVKEVTA